MLLYVFHRPILLFDLVTTRLIYKTDHEANCYPFNLKKNIL